MTKFSIIHASYGRPELARATAKKWLHAADNSPIYSPSKHDFEYLLSIDKSDPKFDDYQTAGFREDIFVINYTNTSVAAINAAAAKSTGDILIVISDDFEPILNWPEKILEVVAGKSDWILKTQDGVQPWIITLPIMDRFYYQRFGYVYPPEYTHMFCDTHITHNADLLGRKLTCDLLFKHNHYSVGGIKKDATSEKADATWEQGEKIYLTYCQAWREVFPDIYALPPEASDLVNWLKKKI